MWTDLEPNFMIFVRILESVSGPFSSAESWAGAPLDKGEVWGSAGPRAAGLGRGSFPVGGRVGDLWNLESYLAV